ncbi:MAG: serine/threonine protein kinase [Actinobacteria bacterium]|nr:serine/threonine protein kinase [Actinomycetota bacterium]
MSAVVGVHIPGYEVLEAVGRGGHAVVFQARQIAFDRIVALKVISGVDIDGSTQRRFERECRVAGALSWHPHIVAVHDAGTTDEGAPYIAMEYCEAGSLGDRLARLGGLGWPEVTTAAVQLCGALETAHRAGTLHRDVKPENVLVGLYGEVKLSDFGIAALQRGSTVTAAGVVTTTVAHAAPEVLAGAKSSPASDVYSLGSTVFTLLSGKPAFLEPTDEVLATTIARIATSPVPDLRPAGVPDGLAALIEASMSKDPATRPLSAAALGEGLRSFQAQVGQPVGDMRLRDDLKGTVAIAEPPPVPAVNGPPAVVTPPPVPAPPTVVTPPAAVVTPSSAAPPVAPPPAPVATPGTPPPGPLAAPPSWGGPPAHAGPTGGGPLPLILGIVLFVVAAIGLAVLFVPATVDDFFGEVSCGPPPIAIALGAEPGDDVPIYLEAECRDESRAEAIGGGVIAAGSSVGGFFLVRRWRRRRGRVLGPAPAWPT